MNELIEIAGKIHNTLSCILIKYNKGIPLTELEEDVLSELYVCSEEKNLSSIDELPIEENKYITQLIMTKQTAKSGKPEEVVKKLNLHTEVKNVSGESFTTGDEAYFEVKKLIENKATLDFIYSFCTKKASERKLTIKDVLKGAILGDDKDKTANEKYDLYKLVIKIEREEGEFTTNEKDLIKKAVGKVWNIEVTGFVWNFIDSL